MMNGPPSSRQESNDATRRPPSAGIMKRAQDPSLPHMHTRRWRSTSAHHAPGFWELLTTSQIPLSLTKRALHELDRRNDLDAAKEPKSRITAQEYLPPDVKRFSRHADYADLRGVCLTYFLPTSLLMTEQQTESESKEVASNQSRLYSVSNEL